MIQPEYWYNLVTLTKNSYNRYKSSAKNVIFLPNGDPLKKWYNVGVYKVGVTSNLLCNGRTGVGSDRYRQLQQGDGVGLKNIKSSIT